jgi:hypothetical protein
MLTRQLLTGNQLMQTTRKQTNVLQLVYIIEVIRKSDRLSDDHHLFLMLLLVPSQLYVTDRSSIYAQYFVPASCSSISGIYRSWVPTHPFTKMFTVGWLWSPFELGRCNGGEVQICQFPNQPTSAFPPDYICATTLSCCLQPF